MPRPRTRPINSYILKLMKEADCENLADLARKIGVPKTTLYAIADIDRKNLHLQAHFKIASELGVPWEKYTTDYLRAM